MKLINLSVLLAVVITLYTDSLTASDSAHYQLSEHELKQGLALNRFTQMESCKTIETMGQYGCCDPDNNMVDAGTTIDYQGTAFECVATPPKDLTTLFTPERRQALTRYQWIHSNIIEYCAEAGLSLDVCSERNIKE